MMAPPLGRHPLIWPARAAVAALTLVLVACQPGAAQLPSGRIAWPRDGDLWVYNTAAKDAKKITNLPRSAAVTGAAWSADGTRIVYAQFWRRPGETVSGADLMVAGADGSDPHSFADRDVPSTVLDTPSWTASGRLYYTQRRVQGGREHQSVVRQLEGGSPETVVDDAFSASVTADESTIVYVRNTAAGQELRRKALAEAGDGCVLIPDTVFQLISGPRLSPDGKRVAFGGQGEPASQQPAGSCGAAAGPRPAGDALAALVAVGEWLGVLARPAYAHGLPSDIWAINLDGTGFRRVADVKEDEPTVAWSPDGSHLAIFGVAALYAVGAKGGPVQKLVDQGGYGGLDWTK